MGRRLGISEKEQGEMLTITFAELWLMVIRDVKFKSKDLLGYLPDKCFVFLLKPVFDITHSKMHISPLC